MRIRLRNPDGLAEVFAVYWSGQKTLFLGMTEANRGLMAFDADEVEVLDAALSGDFKYYENRFKGIYHAALIEENLLDDLLEYDEGAYMRFMQILGK